MLIYFLPGVRFNVNVGYADQCIYFETNTEVLCCCVHNFFRIAVNKLNPDLERLNGSHGGRVVTLSPPTSEAGVRFPARPQVGKLVVACRWSAVYSTAP